MSMLTSLLRIPGTLTEVSEDLARRIRDVWIRDKEMAAHRWAEGEVNPSTNPNDHLSVINDYGSRLATYLRVEHDLLTRYLDYETMDDYGEVAAVLNIYGDDATQPDTVHGRRVWVQSPDKDLELLLNGLLHDRLRIDEDLHSITRTCCKYGTDAEEIIVHPDEGVVALNHLPTPTFRRIEGTRGRLYGFVQDFSGRLAYTIQDFQKLLEKQRAMGSPSMRREPEMIFHRTAPLEPIAFEPWQVVQFRHHGKYRNSIYGHAVLEPARWIFRRLILLEDLAVLYRAQRAPERHAFYVNVGNRPLNEARALLNEVKQMYKKKKFVNPATGKLDMRLETLAPDEDIFIPVVDGNEMTRIDTITAPSWQHMDDIEYFLKKLFGALHVPRAYLGQDENLTRQTLSSEDVRFARTVLRVQQAIKLGIEKICRVHLAALDIPLDDVVFSVHMTVPSAIYELAQVEVKSAQAGLALQLVDSMSDKWIKRNIHHLSDEEIEEVWKEREAEAVRKAKMEAAAMKIMGGAGGGGGFGGRRFESRDDFESHLRRGSSTGIPGKELLSESRRSARMLQNLLNESRGSGRRLAEVRELVRELSLSSRR